MSFAQATIQPPAAPAEPVTHEQLDVLIHDWNKLAPQDRTWRLNGCRRKQHDWRRAPLRGTEVCLRCLTYRPASVSSLASPSPLHRREVS